MPLIQIKLINGEPMGRPKNPQLGPKDCSYRPAPCCSDCECDYWDKFEQSVTYHPAPGCEESDGVEGEIRWRAKIFGDKQWELMPVDHEPINAMGVINEQIWVIPSQHENTMRKNILTDEIEPTDIVRVKIIKEPETGWYIGKVGAEYDCVYDYKGNFMPVEDVKAVKDGKSFTTRIIKPTDAEIVDVSPSQKVEVKEVDNFGKWINVAEDHLPSDKQEILFILKKSGDMRKGMYYTFDQWDREQMFVGDGYHNASTVTHWMPLPEKPTK